MSATDQIRKSMMIYTSIYSHPLDVVYHMMLTNGNGYDWNSKGELTTWDSDRGEYKYSEFPLQAAQEKFVHDNIDLLMNDMGGIFGGPTILSHLNHVYHGHSKFETVPLNVSNGWEDIVWQTYCNLTKFVNPHVNNEFYHKFQYDQAVKLIASFRETEYYKEIGAKRDARFAEVTKMVLEKLRGVTNGN